MSFLTGNVRNVGFKLDEIQLLAAHHRPDVLIFTDSWLPQDILDAEVNLPGQMPIRSDRLCECAGGGVIIYQREHLKAHLLDIVCNAEEGFKSVWCRINDGQNSVTIGAVYRAHTTPGAGPLELLKKYSVGKDFLIIGDFNAPGIE